MLTYGSLFSGYGGLDMGVQAVLPGRTAWHVEFDSHPSRILAHHWPDVPNYGDVTSVDWTSVEPVDVLTGGFPCQDVSHAGRRAGLIRDGEGRTRSGLWGQMLRAIDTLRPRLVVAENVRGLLSAKADSDVEPCPWCMGDAGASPMRALGAVLGDLADLGYDAAWYGLRAADVGAAHGRFRVFIFAWPAGADAGRVPAGELGAGLGLGPEGYEEQLFLTPRATDGTEGGEVPLLGTPRASEWKGTGPVGSKSHAHRLERDYLDAQVVSLQAARLLPTPAANDPFDYRRNPDSQSGKNLCAMGLRSDTDPDQWGDYAPAIARWETVIGRPAPTPTETGSKGSPRLSARFVEWLMGLPEGHVTDPVIWDGLRGGGRNQQLKALGNGVVPQQVAAATAAWLQDMQEEGHQW